MNAEGKSVAGRALLEQEFHHLRSDWLWLLLYGILLVVCGVAAIIFPALTSVAAMVVLGVVLMIAGVATIIQAFWAGKWSGLMLQLLVGILYTAVGFMIIDTPLLKTVEALTLFIAAFFIVVGGFRIVSSLVIRFPYWGWSLLNGIITFLLGVIIYRLYDRFPESSLWILGLLIGIEMLFHGWTWIVLSLAIKKLPEKAA
ncbi:MAG: HdeD family acid-resistance protein [Planctomycetes bacterium]|nr:HdeD family acid-resistance protein [Planctomycetota bacterium]MBU4398775.1 HdeD family acid-resistance protein [Planctomycetota bacterium]MCG2685039.1 HdeD family acid-resistance protein [Planctomycetales bacterium]